MPKGGITHLRIYCICGQKMRMSEDMFGRPGKCIACRQKIRIPRLDEIPENTDEIHIKDFPQFLRGPVKKNGPEDKARPRDKDGRPDSAAPKAPAKGAKEKAAKKKAVPLDVLEPLRVVCSAEHNLERRLAALDDGSGEGDRSEFEEQLERVRRVRSSFNEQLRQLLMEVTIELTSTQDKIIQAQLSARTGETLYGAFLQNAERLRTRRDRLRRRQQNLRGWLAIRDPYLAGGLLDVPIESVPDEGFTLSVPSEPDETDALISIGSAALRDAFERWAEAKRELSELERLEGGASPDAAGIDVPRRECKARKKRAEAAIDFWRGRLTQLKDDYDSDNETAEAQLDLMRGRMQAEDFDRGDFDQLEAQIRRAKQDTAKSRAFVKQALSANSAQDVPHLRATIMARRAVAGDDSATGIDSWIAWVAALVLGGSIFLPAVEKFSLAKAFFEFDTAGTALRWIFLVPIVFGVAVALIAAIPNRSLRGRTMAFAWLAGTFAGAILIHHFQFGLDDLSARFRAGPAWITRPGMLLLILADLGVLAAAAVALVPLQRERIWVSTVVILGVLSIVSIFTDLGGYRLPKPAVDAAVVDSQVTVTIRNDGRGALAILPQVSSARGAYLYAFDKQIGPESWSKDFEQGDLAGDFVLLETESLTLGPGESRELTGELSPGDYRIQLISKALDNEVEKTFTVEAPPEEAVQAPDESLEAAQAANSARPGNEAPQTESATDESAELSAAPEVELKGILAAPNRPPKFSFIIRFRDGTQQKATLSLGQNLYGLWDASEYDSIDRSVTLRSKTGLLILRTGDRQTLSP